MPVGLATKALIVWLVILTFAVANGLLRDKVIIPHLGTVPGMVLSGTLLSCIVFAVAYIVMPWVGARDSGHFVLIGTGWLLLTLIFEFSFGLSRGEELSAILDAYTFKGGNLWPVVLLVTAMSPWLAAKLRGLV